MLNRKLIVFNSGNNYSKEVVNHTKMKKILLIIFVFHYYAYQAQIVTIPDIEFKTELLENYNIDINNDGEIQYSEAELYNGHIDVSFNFKEKNYIYSVIGIEAFINLTHFSCNEQPLTEIDLSNNIALMELSLIGNQLTEINVSNNINLIKLNCSHNQISNIDISNNLNLSEFNFASNNINSIDLSNNISLTRIICNNSLGEIDISNLINLESFVCNYCELNDIDLSNNINLNFLHLEYNNLVSLDVSNNINIYHILCRNNIMPSIDVSNNIYLSTLVIGHNLLSTIDLSSNLNLIRIELNDNELLTYANLKNGNNHNNSFLSDFENLPNLEYVCVDDVNSEFVDFINDDVGHFVNFTENCDLSINENNSFNFIIYPIPTKNIMIIESQAEISKIEIYNNLGQLILKNKMENQLDISNIMQGLYFVKVEDVNGNCDVKKLIKK